MRLRDHDRFYEIVAGPEEWHPIPGLDKYYDVSTKARVRSWRGWKGSRANSPTLLDASCRIEQGDGHKSHDVASADVRELSTMKATKRVFDVAFCICHVREHQDPDVLSSQLTDVQPRGQLNEEKVREIKLKLAEGYHYATLADEYGVAKGTIGDINNGKTWSHVSIGNVDTE